jgi:hypothetical protein
MGPDGMGRSAFVYITISFYQITYIRPIRRLAAIHKQQQMRAKRE